VGDLIDVEGFTTALLVGAVVALVLAVVRGRARERGGGFAPALFAGVLAGLHVADLLPAGLVVGLVMVAVGSQVSAGWWGPFRPLTTLPGALVLAAALPDRASLWMATVAVVVTVVGGSRSVTLERAAPGASAPLLAMSALAVYVCVPETSTAGVVAGAFVAAAALGILLPAFSPAGAALGVALIAWSAAADGSARPGAVVGALGTLGVVLFVPRLRRMRWWGGRSIRSSLGSLAVVHGMVALYAARVCGLRHSAWTALILLVPGLLVGAAVARWALVPRMEPGEQW
jgi:hypothetical protein